MSLVLVDHLPVELQISRRPCIVISLESFKFHQAIIHDIRIIEKKEEE